MSSFLSNLFTGVGITDIVDVVIVAIVVYKILGFIKETRAEQLAKGLLILVVANFASKWLHLYTLNWILVKTMDLGVIALIIVFQPELRRGLEYLGRSKILSKQFGQMDKDKAKQLTSVLIKAVDYFSTHKVGALIIMEQETTLSDIAETGTIIDAQVSTELLENLFYEGSPLHDGAVILRGNRIWAGGCVLPLTQNKNLSKELGTRHRAGIGITENSDAISLIVSEETGIISTAVDGKLSRFLDLKTVEKTLLNVFLSQVSDGSKMSRVPFVNKLRRNSNDEQ